MGTLQSHRIHLSLFPLLFLLHFSLASEYKTQEKYFINCGSDKNETNPDDSNQVFVGESNAEALEFSFTKKDSTVESTQSSVSVPPLYQTARIFKRQNSSYKFTIDTSGTYILRLHFFTFSSPSNLSSAVFNVWVDRFWLFQNFSAKNYTNSSLVEEFFLNINSSSFKVYFAPQESSFAFINAIELFLLPSNFIPDGAESVSSKGNESDYKGVLSMVLHTNFRLDVGAAYKEFDNFLWRRWEPDDAYLSDTKNAVTNSSEAELNYEGNNGSGDHLATRYIAMDNVYKTYKSAPYPLNTTWILPLKRNSFHLLRLHFCDMISVTLNLTLFDLLLYNNFSRVINSNDVSKRSYVPFYYDFVVEVDDSGILNITIVPRDDSPMKEAYLNGLEVMEIINKKGPVAVDAYDEDNKENHLPLKLRLTFGALALICILVLGFILHMKFRKPKPVENLDWWPVPIDKGESSHSKWGSTNINLGLKISFHEIQFATDNFNVKGIIGKGGFGIVYKGVLKNGMRIAVKRREDGSEQGISEFQTEITVLTKIRHRHLVSLIGYCNEGSEMILLYEYMEKGTLKDHLFNSNLASLSWRQRLEICIGAAKGLHYLHKESTGRIIHRDVKSTNILLDENLVAKVSDFGLSRSGPLDNLHPHVTTGVKGTFGYIDPDYFKTYQLTEKSDVYSFGVVLLEVLCARSAFDRNLPWDQVNLAEWGICCMNKGTLEEIMDPSIKGQIDANSLRKFGETIEKCLREDGVERPSMVDVVWDLEYALQLQIGAIKRTPQDDSSSCASASLGLQNLPSLSALSEMVDESIVKDKESDSSGYYTFSMMKIGEDR